MQEFVIRLHDKKKVVFLLELLSQLDFVEVQPHSEPKAKKKEEYDFFQSAGLFAHRNVDAQQLRKEAWRIKK